MTSGMSTLFKTTSPFHPLRVPCFETQVARQLRILNSAWISFARYTSRLCQRDLGKTNLKSLVSLLCQTMVLFLLPLASLVVLKTINNLNFFYLGHLGYYFLP